MFDNPTSKFEFNTRQEADTKYWQLTGIGITARVRELPNGKFVVCTYNPAD